MSAGVNLGSRKRPRSSSGSASRPLTAGERRTEEQAAHGREHRWQRPAVARQFLHRPDDRQDRCKRQHHAARIDRAGGGAAVLRKQSRADDQQHGRHRYAEQEDRAPPEGVEQDAADHRPEQNAGQEAAEPDSDRPAELRRGPGTDCGAGPSSMASGWRRRRRVAARLAISISARSRTPPRPRPGRRRPIRSAAARRRPIRSPRVPIVTRKPASRNP